MKDCLFCRIISGDIPCQKVHEDELCLAIVDIKPQAPQHILIIPKKHIATTNDIAEEDTMLIGHLFQAAKKITAELNLQQDGYRLVFNCNQHGGQEVYHIHLHLLAGRQMTWPPG